MLTENSACVFEYGGQRRVVRRRIIDVACEAHGGI